MRCKAERAAVAGQRKSAISSTTILFVILAATVLTPWLIGFLLRDSGLLPRTVNITDARNLWAYFDAFYLKGLGALYVLVLLARTRKGRSAGTTISLLVLLVALPMASFIPARSAWNGTEVATAEVIRTTPPGNR